MTKPTKGSYTQKALMAGAAIVSITAGASGSAQAASGTGTAEALLLTPIVITAPTNISFGEMTVRAAGAGGAVIQGAVAARALSGGTVGGDLTLINRGVPTLAAGNGIINIAGDNVGIDLSIDPGVEAGTFGGEAVASGYRMTNGGTTPNQTIVFGNFNLVTDAGGDTATVTPAAGTVNVPVGATALVKPTNVVGAYTGTYNITANYQ
jgi:hypothetical protein